MGPQTKAADILHAMKYRSEGEDFREAMNRVAFGLKDDDRRYHELREVLLDMRFCPGGRIQQAIGAGSITTPYNCFVSGPIEDSFVDGPGCIMDRLAEAARTLRMGGGIGYDFSTLRPKGDLIVKLGSAHSSGPVSFMDIYNTIGDVTASAGERRGAQMGIMRIDHPDAEIFLRAKQNDNKLRRFNISLAVTDEFMEAMVGGKEFPLRWKGKTYRTIDAAEFWEKIMRSTWDWAEPGVVFIDAINRLNNLWYCETIAATNPCSEQPLPPYGACLLGSWNLVKYLSKQREGWSFDYDHLIADIPIIVRATDNVVDRARYPLPQQKAEALNKRRMGIGVMGLANAGEALGHPYGSPAFLEFESYVLGIIDRESYRASARLAEEKGSFTLFDDVKYLSGGHAKSLDDETRDLIRRNGIRNSHLTSIAPTGTISLCADNVSSSIEPVFAYKLKRPVTTADGTVDHEVEDYGSAFLGVQGKLAHQVTADEHVAVLITAQDHVDSAVSKTCNVDGRMPWSEFKGIYQKVWEGNGKGCTTYNADGKRGALLRIDPEDQACKIDNLTGQRVCE